MPSGSVKILTQGQTLVVDLLGPAGASVSAWSDAALTSTLSLPATISSDTTIYVRPGNDLTLSIKKNDLEIASEVGTTRLFRPQDGQQLVISPTVNPGVEAHAQDFVTSAVATATFAPLPEGERNPLTGWFHVEGYGAVGDGVADDSAAIQATIAAAEAAGGGTVALLRSSYKVVTGLTRPDPRECVKVRGSSRTGTLITYTGTGRAITVDGTAVEPVNDWGSFESFQLVCQAVAATTAVYLTHAHRGYLHDVYLLGNGYASGSRGVHAEAAYGNYIDKSVVAGFDSGIDLNVENHDFTINDTNIGAHTVCVRVKDSHDVRIRGGQHSGTGTVTVGHMVIAATDECAGFEVLQTHYEGNGLDLAIGRVADGSTINVHTPVLAAARYPSGLTIDRCTSPIVLNARIGDQGIARAFTLTANCSYAKVFGLLLTTGATLSDASGTPTVVSDINGRTGIGTLSPASRLQVAGGDILLDNNTAMRWKDSGGTSRRIGLVTGGNTVMLGDVDNALAGTVLVGAGSDLQTNINGALTFRVTSSTVQALNADVVVATEGKGFRPGGSGGPLWRSGTGTPEGVVTAAVGSMFTRTDGGAATTLYVKESGTGNTGWVAK